MISVKHLICNLKHLISNQNVVGQTHQQQRKNETVSLPYLASILNKLGLKMFAPGKFWVQKLLAQNICINLFAKFGLNLALFSTTATIMTFKVLKVLGNQPLQCSSEDGSSQP